jgi:hypothetical protein
MLTSISLAFLNVSYAGPIFAIVALVSDVASAEGVPSKSS